jgi:hypothetical protein
VVNRITSFTILFLFGTGKKDTKMAAQENKPDIWSADVYGKKVAPFVATLTEKIVSWLDPKHTGKSVRNIHTGAIGIFEYELLMNCR